MPGLSVGSSKLGHTCTPDDPYLNVLSQNRVNTNVWERERERKREREGELSLLQFVKHSPCMIMIIKLARPIPTGANVSVCLHVVSLRERQRERDGMRERETEREMEWERET